MDFPIFPCVEFFAVSQRRNIAGVGHVRLVRAGFFCSRGGPSISILDGQWGPHIHMGPPHTQKVFCVSNMCIIGFNTNLLVHGGQL